MAALALETHNSTDKWQEMDRKDEHKVLAGNRVKSKPAKDAVINGILSSLQTLESPRASALSDILMTEDARSNSLMRPYSPAGSFAGAPFVPFSPNAAYKTSATPATTTESIDEFDNDFAAAPIIPILRISSRSSSLQRASSRSPSMKRTSSRSPSVQQTSSYGGFAEPPINIKRASLIDTQQNRAASNPNKLSSASWIKSQGDSPSIRRLRRISSHDTLRQAQPDKDFQVDQDFIFNGLGTLAAIPRTADDQSPPRTPRTYSTKTIGKQRIHLDSGSGSEDMKIDEAIEDKSSVRSVRSSTTATTNSTITVSTASDTNRSPSIGPSTPAAKVSQRLSRPSPIADSIPLRTSSLRQASNSPASIRRTPRNQRAARSSSMQRAISEDVSDLHWADLGEQDETVKRILELRKRRETRLIDEEMTSLSDTVDTTILQDRDTSLHRYHSSSPDHEHPAITTTSTPETLDTSAGIPFKANKILGVYPQLVSSAHQTLVSSGSSDRDAHAGPDDGAKLAARALSPSPLPTLQQTQASLVESPASPEAASASASASALPSRRPLTAMSSVSAEPTISLEYSYAQAVDALRSAEQENQRRDLEQPKYGMSTLATLRPAPHRRTASQSSNNASPARLRRIRGRGPNSIDATVEEHGKREKSPRDDTGLERRNSVEDTVLTYLRAPRLSQKIADSQTGRRISFSEVGDPKGAAVFVCVGMGLTRYVTAFFDELALTLRLRLITIERPGVGDSQPYNDRSGPLMWPGDVTAVCDHLGISKFSMLAHSAGAVYALATALILPHMLRGSIHLLAPWIPPSQLEARPYSTDNATPVGSLPRGQRFLRVLPTPFLKAANASWINMGSLQPAKRKSSSSPTGRQLAGRQRASSESYGGGTIRRPATSVGARPDNTRSDSLMLMDQFMPETNPMESFALTGGESTAEEKRRSGLFLSATATPTDPNFNFASTALNAAEHAARERQSEFSHRLTQKTWEYAIKDSNPATDLLVCLERNREIGFRYTDVTRRVIITHGAEDKRVPVGNVKWLAEQMNRAALSRSASTGSLSSRESGTETGCEIRILETEGHGLMASPIIMGDILTEIAGFWTAEERGRVAPSRA